MHTHTYMYMLYTVDMYMYMLYTVDIIHACI